MNRLKSEDTEQMAVMDWAFHQTERHLPVRCLVHSLNLERCDYDDEKSD